MAYTAACHAHHQIEVRLARWLLASSDATRSEELLLTQEYIARMLGVRRAGVTSAAFVLRQEGLISYNRGHIPIINHAGLEAYACECYRVTKAQRDLFIKEGDKKPVPDLSGSHQVPVA